MCVCGDDREPGSMELCDDDHPKVCFVGMTCPTCEERRLRRLTEKDWRDSRREVAELKRKITELETR